MFSAPKGRVFYRDWELVLLLSITVVCIQPAAGVSAQTQPVVFQISDTIGGKPNGNFTARIENADSLLRISEIVDGSMTTEAVYNADGTPVSYRKLNPSGTMTLEAAVQDGQHLLVRSGGSTHILTFQNQLIFPGSSLLYFFGSWLSRDSRFPERVVSLLAVDGRSIIDMRVQNAGVESIAMGGKSLRAYRIVMSLANSFYRFFWPHDFKYWYAENGLHFSSYEGFSVDMRPERMENLGG